MKHLVLAIACYLLILSDALASDLMLTKIRVAQQGDASRVTLEFTGKGKPTGRVAIADDKVMIEIGNARAVKNVKIASSKTRLIASHVLREGTNGAPQFALATRVPTKLTGKPVVLPAVKKIGPRLYFEIVQDEAAPAAAKSPPPTAPAPATTTATETATPTPVALSPAHLAELEAAATGGDAKAQLTLAAALARQEKPDLAGALQWYRAAAEQGNGPAAYNVAQYLRMGMGAPASLPAAFLWYERSAAAGFPPAQVALAILLIKGEGVGQDIERARFLLGQAAAAGEPQAQTILQKLGGQ